MCVCVFVCLFCIGVLWVANKQKNKQTQKSKKSKNYGLNVALIRLPQAVRFYQACPEFVLTKEEQNVNISHEAVR